jgi:hypothetical protein
LDVCFYPLTRIVATPSAGSAFFAQFGAAFLKKREKA